MKTEKPGLTRMAVRFLVMLLAAPAFFGSGLTQDEPSALAVHMKAINKNFKQLRRQMDDTAKKKSNLALIAEIKEHFQGAQKEPPAKLGDVPESEQEAFIKGYKAQMDEVIIILGRLESAVKEGRQEEARTLLKKLNEQKKEGHNAFQE